MRKLPIVIELPHEVMPTLHAYLLMYPRFTMYFSIYTAANLLTAWVGNYIVYRLALRRVKRSPLYYLYLIEKELGK